MDNWGSILPYIDWNAVMRDRLLRSPRALARLEHVAAHIRGEVADGCCPPFKAADLRARILAKRAANA